MKECPGCKTKNQNDAAFCAGCGASLKDVPTQADEWAATAGDLLNKAKGAAAIGARKAKEAAAVGAQKAKEAAGTGAEKMQKAMEDAEKKREAAKAAGVSAGGIGSAAGVQSGGNSSRSGVGDVFVDQSESVVSTIGNSYLQNYLMGGSVKTGIGILTQKRFYYKGRNFSGEGKAMKHTTEEGMVSIDDITFTKFSHTRHIGMLISAILMTVAAAFIFTIPHNAFRSDTPYFFAMFLFAAAVVCYITYFINRQTLFQVSFPGGSFGFDVRYYPIADIRDFQRQLHLLKDHRKESTAV